MDFINYTRDESKMKFNTCILIKENSFNRGNIDQYYVSPITCLGADRNEFMAASLPYGRNNKVTSAQMTDNFEYLLPSLKMLDVKLLVVADSSHFKKLTGAKPDESYDVVTPCKLKGYEDFNAIYTLNFSSLLYNPDQQDKIDIANETISRAMSGNSIGRIGIPFEEELLLTDQDEILDWLEHHLHDYDELAVDIETFGLKLGTAGIGTITFAWSAVSGIAFAVDYRACVGEEGFHGYRKDNKVLRKALLNFFESYRGKLVGHGVSFDFKHIIWELFMKHPLDRTGMIHGIETLCRDYECTKLMAFAAYNSTSRPSKKLKDLVYEYAGSYAQDDIKDIRKIDLYTLLKYNLTDGCATYWLRNQKLIDKLEEDDQLEFYESHLKKVQKYTLMCELTGMPVCDKKVKELEDALTKEIDSHMAVILNNAQVLETEYVLQCEASDKYNRTHKVKRKSPDDFSDLKLNVNSNTQLRVLLYDVIGFSVIRKTKSGLPATGGKVLKLLLNQCKYDSDKELLNALIGYAESKKILNDFVPVFKAGILKADSRRYVHGNINIGGTASGRNSSSEPNLQNLPANGKWGKMVKECFVAPEGWVFCFVDFAALEDRISALLSRDPNKLKIYIDGFDGHSVRTLRYFKHLLPPIDPTDVDAVNAIETDFPDLRKKSKAPTFLMTYLGTAIGLVMNCGFERKEADFIYAAFHEEYAATDAYNQRRLEEAARQGYITLAFGLRLRCPLLKRSPQEGDRRSFKTLSAEKRTVNNADGQSYGMLNDRAVAEHMERVWNSEYREDILYINPIHDATYYLVRDDIDTLMFHNDSIVSAMQWQEDPRIAHDEVKLGGSLEIGYTSWADPISIPNYADKDTFFAAWDKGVNKIKSADVDEEAELRDLFREDEDEEEED